MPPPAGIRDTDFNQADVGLRGCLHAVRVQDDLAAPANCQTGGRDNDRHVRVAQRHRGLLEGTDHQIDLVPILFLCFEQDEHQVCAGGEVNAVVAHDQRREVLRRFADAFLQHLDRVAADRVHLRMELDRQHAVAEIDEARPGILPHDGRPLLR